MKVMEAFTVTLSNEKKPTGLFSRPKPTPPTVQTD